MQKLCKNYAKKLRKIYAYVCKLHNLHYNALPTVALLMGPGPGAAAATSGPANAGPGPGAAVLVIRGTQSMPWRH